MGSKECALIDLIFVSLVSNLLVPLDSSPGDI